jgi:RNA polymerase sigma-70 factor (ECF subfamily)
LFATEVGYVGRTLRRLGVRDADLEDVTHDVFLQVYGKMGTYDPERPSRPWLFAFAFRLASDYRRRAHRRTEVGAEHLEAASDRPLADALLIENDRRALVDAALASIDLDRRAVLIGHEMDEIPMKEIAESLAIPLHTAYSRLRTAREEFARAVRRLQKREGDG